MKNLLVLALILLLAGKAYSQKYRSESGVVSFFSETPMENISAQNKNVSSIFNSTTGDIVFSLPANEFHFEKSLMEDHFNEKYLETEKYPKATFQGKVTGYNASGVGAQEVKATGKLMIHGVTQDVDIPGTLELAAGKLELKSKFNIKLADYKVEIPQLLWKNISEQVEVKLNLTYKSL